jgi:Skp family chaperone for outer membrane proteins
VKRIVIVALGAVALAGVVFYVGRLWAQTTTPARPAEPKTRIALLNLSHVIKNYAKFKAYEEEIKTALEPYQKKEEAWRKEAEELTKKAQAPTTSQEEKDRAQKRLTEIQRSVEDNRNEVRKIVTRKQDEGLTILYREVQDVATRIARSQGFEMVLHYNDYTEPKEYWSVQNILRKMQAGALMPLYWEPGLEISQQVVANLNATYKPSAPAAARPTAPATGGTH